jgi:hypothetical protein
VPPPSDLTGQQFNRLFVTRRIGSSASGKTLWLCECSCGKVTQATAGDLRSGQMKSCGCLKREMAKARATTHGHATPGRKHPLYRIWGSMIQRCVNPLDPHRVALSKWPGAWAADAGIDLVAEETDGRLSAIQAKAYDAAYAIKKADVDSFLSESSRPEFSYRLLIATTDRLGPTARRTLDSQREPVGYLLRACPCVKI